MNKQTHYSTLQICVPLFANYISSVSVVLVNKYVTQKWPFSYTLTCIHFMTTFIVLLGLCCFGFFPYKKLSILSVSQLSLMFALSIVLNNNSLQHNTVGFYQTMKIAITPVVAIIEVVFLHDRLPTRLYLPILSIISGVGLSTVKDFRMNVVGTLYGVSSVFVTAIYQVMSRTKQDELQCTSLQLLLFETPISALMLIMIIPFLENYDTQNTESIWNVNYDMMLIIAIVYTACAAVVINISIFLAIRRSSALTYNIISQLKGMSILICGSFLFHESLTLQQKVGMVLAIGGIIDYSRIRLSLQQKDRK